MIYLTNAFSIHMLDRFTVDQEATLVWRRIDSHEAGRILRSGAFRSYYGHGISAEHLSRYLKIDIPVSRGYMELTPNDTIIIAGITGKRKWESGVKPCPGWIFFKVNYAQRRATTEADSPAGHPAPPKRSQRV